MQDDGRALRAVGVFVEVHRHRRDARHAKIELAELCAEAFEVRQQEAADAAVDVEVDLVLLRDGADRFDRVENAMRV
jgi:hypothetical protein